MINNLFSKGKFDELVKKHENIFEIDDTKINAIQKWQNMLMNGDLEDEIANYGNFQDIILRQLLGYSIDDIKTNYATEGNESIEFALVNEEDEVYVAIELKGSTADLIKYRNSHKKETVMQQVARYATYKKSFKWCIASNYDTFIFFDKQSREEYISFKFEELNDIDILKKFLFVFSKISLIINDFPSKLQDETVLIERKLEDEFYQLYSETRLMFIKELENSSQDIDRLDAINLSQLILNRFIFLCFAEDIELIRRYTIADVLLTPIKHKNLFEFTMWERLNELFRFADKGNEEKGIHAFNGGLFKKNLRHLEIRDKIDDISFFDDCRTKWSFNDKYDDIENKLGVYKDVLNPIYKNLLTISSFDFGSELSVNILGHIFENSISDIEELKEDTIEKRKKDGVFYTPEYITDYICRNAILSYLSKSGNAQTIHELIMEYESTNTLEELDYKLKNIKILDPACGSGSILNKSVDILINIHKNFHDIKYANDQSLNPFIDNLENRKQILTNNIFGVDLNEESVEITKLSLFLKLATTSGLKKGFKLPNLDKNIKCGNSVIDSNDYDDKAFNWELEFKEILNNGGFDVIVGNPPYVRQELIKEIKPYLEKKYETYKGTADLYIYFFEKSLKMLKENGVFSVICSSKFSKVGYGELLRDFIIKNYNINLYEDYSGEKLFADATTYPCIIQITNEKTEDNEIFVDREYFMKQSRLSKKSWTFKPEPVLKVKDKLEIHEILKNNSKLNINRGFTTGCNDAFVIDEETKNQLVNEDITNLKYIKPLLRGRNLKRWQIHYDNIYLIYSPWDMPIDELPSIKKHFEKFYTQLSDRIEVKENKYSWYCLSRYNAKAVEEFEKPKLLYSMMVQRFFTVYDEKGFFLLNSAFIISSTSDDNNYLKALAAILSSNPINFYINMIVDVLQGKTYSMKKIYVEQLPIPNLELEDKMTLSNLVENIQSDYAELYSEKISFIDWVKREFNIERYPQNAEEFYKMTFDEFFNVLEKKRKIPHMNKQKMLKEQFNESSSKISYLRINIGQLEKNINNKVYELYDLTDEEIKIIESVLNE